jgi:hypothetical protein
VWHNARDASGLKALSMTPAEAELFQSQLAPGKNAVLKMKFLKLWWLGLRLFLQEFHGPVEGFGGPPFRQSHGNEFVLFVRIGHPFANFHQPL